MESPSVPDVQKFTRQSTYRCTIHKVYMLDNNYNNKPLLQQMMHAWGQNSIFLPTQSAISCDDYPVINYTLEITRVGVTSSRMKFTSVENFMKTGNLSDDAVYVYRLSASNSVGTVSTNYSQEICKFVMLYYNCVS